MVIYPVLVQGQHAAADIARAISTINDTMDDIDVILCGRGGGSAEDLWSFNEEVVADAIYASRIPVVSAVGHETDFTIADFVADMRAETPTAAAQMVVPKTKEVLEKLENAKELLQIAVEKKLDYCEKQLSSHNMNVVGQLVKNKVSSSLQQIQFTKKTMDAAMDKILIEKQRQLEMAETKLQGASPYGIMEKGYAAITDENGRLVTSIGSLKASQKICITGADAIATAIVKEVSKNAEEKDI